MLAPRIELFDWLLHNASKASYNLAYSNIQGVTMGEYERITSFPFSDEFDLGVNAQEGAWELKEVLYSRYGCASDNIVTTTGASEANFLVFASLLAKGDEFIIEQPGYQPMWLTPAMLGARRISWPRRFHDKFRADIESLERLFSKKTKLVVLTNLHNPSGVLTEKHTIQTIARLAKEHNAYVLVDEIFLDGSFVSQPSSFGLPNVIVTTSTTKIYGLGGLHTGWIVAPHHVIELCQRFKAHSTGASSYTSELMTAQILRNAREKLIQRFQKRSTENLRCLEKWMDEHAEWFEWVKPDGGLVCFPRYSMDISSLKLCTYLMDTQKILLNPGSFFNLEGFIRLSYGCDTPLLQEALQALEKGLEVLQT
ncbi:MAG: aminotransferase class I/II-fold pyridoxal phosphate-dependent enzyme [Candidatus Thermoplasmatota archaeon]|nr:aminotransferase class I/II-fold pyridoxal phosphate-dependent enzyme [Candidatus Thermoplasmatota archaeon]